MADETDLLISSDFTKLKVPDLRKELKLRGLSTSGNKMDLIERLQDSMKSNGDMSSKSVDDLEEDLLDDEDDEHIEASESILEHDLDESLVTTKRKLDDAIDNSKHEPPKKVVLNRNNSIITADVKPLNEPEEKSPEQTSNGNNKTEEKKIVKLSELSAKERLEMRAKKFGVTNLSTDAKKAVRAERFKDNSSSSITSSNVNTNIDVLKQRAARFGTSVSSVMSGLENKEKMEKRKNRFGAETSTVASSESDKAKLRLERFKQPIK
ncbi:unnamed protein product [Phyllotreta striolata]|uniref:SAP domain-containing protein n=1 Tax=Phyllotreta striolata TaxID=444603 RepID=A0A9N9TYN9_PHYSR|nr:unnamed protein product [Phyllotreta striolata]